jgi:ribose 5-phosphate isomerase B
MRIALGSDHRGAEAVQALVDRLRGAGHEPIICGVCTDQPCDYPDNAYLVAKAVSSGEADFGILVCGTGIGMSIAANKFHGVRAAVVYDEFAAEISRRHNDANVLCMSGDLNTTAQHLAMAEAFIAAEFEGGRHARRVNKIIAIEKGEDPSTVTETAAASEK